MSLYLSAVDEINNEYLSELLDKHLNYFPTHKVLHKQ